VAAEIGVGERLLGRWVRLQPQATAAGDTGAALDADERTELERLRRKNAELCMDREFLKKAAVLFVSEHEAPQGLKITAPQHKAASRVPCGWRD
jgi:transposase